MFAHNLKLGQDSGLSWHLDPGSIVIQLDDTPLGEVGASRDLREVWAQYLMEGGDQKDVLGWCIEHSAYQGMFA
jgi:hypothetical protein